MIILGIETSCDETAAAIVQKTGNRIKILSNVVASSAKLQEKFGGVIPEQAAREQLKTIIPVIETTINDSRLTINDINAIAVTYGPGLIGSLLVGVETAKTLAFLWNKPLIPVNHLLGHFYANWISSSSLRASAKQSSTPNEEIATSVASLLPRNDKFNAPTFPCIGLLVSGGHTDLILFKDHGKYEYLGGTRDDAAGECFDKCARLLGLPYPGGPAIAHLARTGDPKAFDLPRPMLKDFSSKGRPAYGWDFSFSGLKTAVANLLHTSEVEKSSYTSEVKYNLAASIEAAIVDVLVAKTIKAAQFYHVNQIMIAGGVAANQTLVRNLKLKIKNLKLNTKLFVPPPELCTDNAGMIATAAFFNYPPTDPLKLQANPNLSLS
ncbi:MAG: tRNA (adenosine(37)-N6)-threonylcarbamoyltransferase complex transferase subunit TsaD [Candidatus Daviesbacteria bacterium]|nr:tRNA (adenosine(37)-N6)-threonylcarbamoyltransferase complex transferase subunit TsaD [Candidatus Daviesbacteria bacterium]